MLVITTKTMYKILREIFSSKSNLSSKRIIGTLCIIVYIGILIGTFLGLDITSTQASLLNGLLIAGTGLLGVGVVDRFGSSGYQDYGRIDNYNNMEENK